MSTFSNEDLFKRFCRAIARAGLEAYPSLSPQDVRRPAIIVRRAGRAIEIVRGPTGNLAFAPIDTTEQVGDDS